NPCSRTPELPERLVRLADRVARVGVQLNDRREELGLEPAGQVELLRLADQQLDGRRERERPGVEDHHLLLNPDGKRRTLAKTLLDQEPKAKRLLYAPERAVPNYEFDAGPGAGRPRPRRRRGSARGPNY